MNGYGCVGYMVLGMDPDRPGAPWRDSETDSLPTGVDHLGWMINRWKFTTENLSKWTGAERDPFGAELKVATRREVRYACVGYCAGTLFVCDLLAGAGGVNGESFVTAVGFAHPAALKGGHGGGIKSKLPKN